MFSPARTSFTYILIALALVSVSAFTSNINVAPIMRKTTSLNMVFGPKQALAIERRKNPQVFESTIQGLMTSKRLSREQAEKRYGEFLLDPDGFALKASAVERKEMGYKNWIDQAVKKSDDPEATQKRIDDFTAKNRLKGIAIMGFFSAAVLAYSASNPYVPPV